MRFAQVIVDVPTMQTDRPYSYLIPDDLQELVVPGIRVRVPFGTGNRHVQGFVMAVVDEEPTFDYKTIIEVEDFVPVLNQELLQLSDYMKEMTFSFKITCLQAMLPTAMKTNYEKYFFPTATASPEVKKQFGEHSSLHLHPEKDRHLWQQMAKWQKEGQVEVKYLPQKKTKVKTEKAFQRLITLDEIAQIKQNLRKSAHRQLELLQVLEEVQPEETYFLSDFPDIARSVFNQGQAKGWLKLSDVEVYRLPKKKVQPTNPPQLNQEQQSACEAIIQSASQKKREVFLLEGVTGSGKTEVYLQTIEKVLKQGQTALMLVPEIALTPQIVERFQARFGQRVAVLHSGLSAGEKYDEWRRIERHEADIVVGARSAVFAPLENIGLIIMDEEHESSYKQDENPRYHARDIALWRSDYHQCPLVLGSATPSLETRARAHKGVYQLLRMDKRANPKATLPEVEVIDMTVAAKESPNPDFSVPLLQKIQQRLERHEQMVLLLNQRGYSSFMMCRDCGYVVKCPNCDLSLTYHADPKRLECHYCGHTEAVTSVCPQCHQRHLRYYGTGIQKVEESLKILFPTLRILRLDADTTRKKGSYERFLKQFADHEYDLLLGTQMVAKGLDFPNVTLVGVLNADTSLNLPDFRSSEKTFQLLTQVSGRAGRGDKKGEVIIQTYNPNHYAIQLAQKQDYERFFYQEMQARHIGLYPPYVYTLRLVVSHKEEKEAAKMAHYLARQIRPLISDDAEMLGPTPRSIARVNKRYFYQIILKYRFEPRLLTGLQQMMQAMQKTDRQGYRIFVDRDPLQFI